MSSTFLAILDSSDRDSGTIQSFDIVFNESAPHYLYGLKTFSIDTVVIPLVYYNINTTNNNLDITFFGGSQKTVTIPSANYSAANLATYLQTAITAIAPAAFTVTVDTTYTWRYTFACSTAFVLNFGTGTHTSTSPYTILGFTNTDTASSTSIVAPNPYRLGPPRMIYVHSQRLSSLMKVKNLESEVWGDVIAGIPVNCVFGEVLVYQPSYDFDYDFTGSSMVTDIDLYLTDECLNPIFLQMDWCISLIFQM